MEIYEFTFCECVYEGGMITMSLHKSKKGDYKAMNQYLNDEFNKERNEHLMYGKTKLFDHVNEHAVYSVRSIELKD